ncbi:MAG TPA: hypothetical protein PKX93_04060 [bacterium]|nr:hypothetical protein [bacterium]HOL66616.1 hypothetical protein [bacterium]HPP11818.1 hypothetical protein [bacterium]
MVTKVEAIRKVLEEFNGVATWEQIYNNIEKYYPAAKRGSAWMEGIRGVLYRELKNNRNFKRIGLGIYSLKEYEEEPLPKIREKDRMHSYMEGICLEIGKFKNFEVYTPDRAALFRDGIYLKDIVTLIQVPSFTYAEIVKIVKKIDVLWFNKVGLRFPKQAIEIVDTIGTLSDALNRCLQLSHFNTNFWIIGPPSHRNRFEQKVSQEPYVNFKERFRYADYQGVIQLYEAAVHHNKMETELLGTPRG